MLKKLSYFRLFFIWEDFYRFIDWMYLWSIASLTTSWKSCTCLIGLQSSYSATTTFMFYFIASPNKTIRVVVRWKTGGNYTPLLFIKNNYFIHIFNLSAPLCTRVLDSPLYVYSHIGTVHILIIIWRCALVLIWSDDVPISILSIPLY